MEGTGPEGVVVVVVAVGTEHPVHTAQLQPYVVSSSAHVTPPESHLKPSTKTAPSHESSKHRMENNEGKRTSDSKQEACPYA